MECHLIRLIPLPGDSVNVLIARKAASGTEAAFVFYAKMRRRRRRQDHFGMDVCRNEFCLDARPHLFPLPPGEDNAANGFWLAENCPANPVARIFKKAADDSPSPRRRGPG
jgi:hypothetical protein